MCESDVATFQDYSKFNYRRVGKFYIALFKSFIQPYIQFLCIAFMTTCIKGMAIGLSILYLLNFGLMF